MNHDCERETSFKKKKKKKKREKEEESETGLARAHFERFIMTPADPPH